MPVILNIPWEPCCKLIRPERIALAPRQPGKFKLLQRTREWFPATAAHRPTDENLLTARIGRRCFGYMGTKQIE